MNADELVEKLKKIREEKGISALELNNAIDQEKDYIQKAEEGEMLLSRNDIKRICAYFNITLDTLFNEENDKEVLMCDINNELKKYDVEELLKFYYLIKK